MAQGDSGSMGKQWQTAGHDTFLGLQVLQEDLEWGGSRMKWNQFFGGILIGLAFGIMVGVAVAPGSSAEKVSTSTAGFCTILVITAAAVIGKDLRRSRLKETANEPAPDADGPGLEDKTPPAR